MKSSKIFLFSMIIISLIVFLVMFFVILPIHYQHIALKKDEHMLDIAEKKSGSIIQAMDTNAKQLHFLQDRLQEKPLLPLLENTLSENRLSIESIKPDQGSEHNEIHLIAKGDYRALLNFIALLARNPSSIIFQYVSIEKNQIEIFLKNDNEKISTTKEKHDINILSRLNSALISVDAPTPSDEPALNLKNVQSPFVPRSPLLNKKGVFYSLENTSWHLSGEVRKNGILLGVFLETEDHSKSYYFGIELPWENSDWHIVNITQRAVIFEETKKHTRWSLSYSRFK